MINWLRQLFCNHEFKKLKDDSYLCKICDKTKVKTIPNIRKTNSYNNNMTIIKRQVKREEEKKRKEKK